MRSLDQLDDLMNRIAERDRGAFQTLYSATSSKVFGLLIRILGNRRDAEIALVETFARIWRNAPRHARSGLDPLSSLLTVARNVGVAQLRARRDLDPDEPLPNPQGSEVKDPAAKEARALEAHLSQLDEARAAAIRAAYFDGLDYAQLADRHEVPLNTVRAWLRRSLHALAEAGAK